MIREWLAYSTLATGLALLPGQVTAAPAAPAAPRPCPEARPAKARHRKPCLHIIHSTVAARSSAPSIRGSGTDVTLSHTVLAHSPAAVSLPSLLLQLPGAARGANGIVHIDGDHGDIDYLIDGVPLPQDLNREVGTEFDLADVSSIEVLEGAYPARYGGRFAAVVAIATQAANGPAGSSAEVTSGSFGTANVQASYHQPLGGGGLLLGLDTSRTDRALDPPDFESPHNRGSRAAQFLRYTLPIRNGDSLDLTAGHAFATYQIPNDVISGEPAATDDVETTDDTFAALQYHHAIGGRGAWTFGPSFKRSAILDSGDPTNDFIFGERQNLTAGGATNACADAMTDGTFAPTTCAYSLSGNIRATDLGFITDYVLQSSVHHTLRAGAAYDLALAPKAYAIQLQPDNFLAPIVTPTTPNAAYTVHDDATNVGHTQSLYVEDAWRMGAYELDSGLRFDAFQLRSLGVNDGAAQTSPRFKFTRFFGRRASVYAYYGRFFTPFSFQNVAPAAAYLLNLPLQRTPAAFDLKPQRDSDYELGGHLPIGRGDLGLRVAQKNASDLIDDTQVGTTALHQDINYALGRIATQSAYYQRTIAEDGRIYAALNHTYSVNKGCETQLLAPCFGSPSDWTPADHQQAWSASAGWIGPNLHGRWFALDGEYGSGLSSSGCAPSTPGFCAYTPHLVFDAEEGVALNPHLALTLRVGNLLDDRYFVTWMNAQGNHVAEGRSITLGLHFTGASTP